MMTVALLLPVAATSKDKFVSPYITPATITTSFPSAVWESLLGMLSDYSPVSAQQQ